MNRLKAYGLTALVAAGLGIGVYHSKDNKTEINKEETPVQQSIEQKITKSLPYPNTWVSGHMDYNKSLDFAESRGERLPYSYEAMEWQNKSHLFMQEIASGYWLNHLMERKGNKLIVYSSSLPLDNAIKEFDVTDVKSDCWTQLCYLPNDLVKFLYGKSYEELSQEFKEGPNHALVKLPPEGKIWPMATGNEKYDIEYGSGRSYLGVRQD